MWKEEMKNFKTYDEWLSGESDESYETVTIDKLPYYHDKMFTCSSFLGFKVGDKVHICSKELINDKYSKPADFTSTKLKQNIVSDIFIYTKKHKIQDIKLVFEYDSSVKKNVTGAEISFEGLSQVFTITNKEQLFKYKTEKVTKFQDDIISHLTYIAEYYKSIKRSHEGTNTTSSTTTSTSEHGVSSWNNFTPKNSQVDNLRDSFRGKYTNYPPPPPPPPDPRIISYGHTLKTSKEHYLEIELFGVDIMGLIRNFFDFMSVMFSFDFSSSIDTTKITKILKKEDRVQGEEFYNKIQEHEEYGRSVDEFVSKYNRRDKIKKLFNEEE